jgi:hypothetical protein
MPSTEVKTPSKKPEMTVVPVTFIALAVYLCYTAARRKGGGINDGSFFPVKKKGLAADCSQPLFSVHADFYRSLLNLKLEK